MGLSDVPVEVIPLVVGFVMWAVTLRLALRVDLDAAAPAPADAEAFDAIVLTTDRPIGYKAAQVIVHGQQAWFAAILHQVYSAAEDARCDARDDCVAPDPECTCGFYAFSAQSDAAKLAARLSRHPVRCHALLQVEMSGAVLAFERGLRAAHQRVLRVEYERWCHRCGRQGKLRSAETLGADGRDRIRQLWSDVRPRSFASLPRGSAPVRPLCTDHAAMASRTMQPVDLAGMLGTEVRWKDA